MFGRVLMRGSRVRYQATGSVKMGLMCTSTTTPTKNWKIGDIYSTTKVVCPQVNVVLYPTISAVA